LDKAFQASIQKDCAPAVSQARSRIGERLDAHRQFVRDREAAGKKMKYTNAFYGFPVVTRQERELMLPLPSVLAEAGPNLFEATYELPDSSTPTGAAVISQPDPGVGTGQLSLFES
jgi:hypothetical protein